jgi:transcriptional regulator with XRE-family HTH domain
MSIKIEGIIKRAEDAGFTLEEFSKAIGIIPEVIRRWDRGKCGTDRVTILAIEHVLSGADYTTPFTKRDYLKLKRKHPKLPEISKVTNLAVQTLSRMNSLDKFNKRIQIIMNKYKEVI